MSPPAPPRAMLRVLSDDRLARLAAGGSESAFAVLYTRHCEALAAYCRSIVRDHDDAGDALQNAMLNAWCGISRRGDAPVRPWLFRIARNESITVLRRRRPLTELRDELPDVSDLHESASHRAELARILDGIDDLTDRQRQALILRTLGGTGYDEIARIQDTTPEAVRQSVSLARRALRRSRLAGLLPLPLPGWLAEIAAVGSVSGGSAGQASLGKVAVTVTAALAAAGAVGDGVPRISPSRSAADSTAQAAVPQAQAAQATAPAKVAAPIPAVSPTSRRNRISNVAQIQPATHAVGVRRRSAALTDLDPQPRSAAGGDLRRPHTGPPWEYDGADAHRQSPQPMSGDGGSRGLRPPPTGAPGGQWPQPRAAGYAGPPSATPAPPSAPVDEPEAQPEAAPAPDQPTAATQDADAAPPGSPPQP